VPKLADSNEIPDFPKLSGKLQKRWKFVIPWQKLSGKNTQYIEK
jgi:hypothetical protein